MAETEVFELALYVNMYFSRINCRDITFDCFFKHYFNGTHPITWVFANPEREGWFNCLLRQKCLQTAMYYLRNSGPTDFDRSSF